MKRNKGEERMWSQTRVEAEIAPKKDSFREQKEVGKVGLCWSIEEIIYVWRALFLPCVCVSSRLYLSSGVVVSFALPLPATQHSST